MKYDWQWSVYLQPAADGSGTRTDGTARAFTETLLKAVLQGIWNSGGKPDTIMVGGFNKQVFSGFTGRATPQEDAKSKKIDGVLNVAPDELAFGPSTSQNAYVLAQAFRGWLPPGAAIVVTDQDHEANSGVWRRLASDGFEIREWRIDPRTGHLDPEALAPLLDGARLLCFPHCSNVVGEVNDGWTVALALLGLLGTVLGMIRAFRDLSLAQGAANASLLADGIWEALVTTAAGLIVAIPAAIAASLLGARVDAAAQKVEAAVGRLNAIEDRLG